MLGLDKLAAAKKKEKLEASTNLSSKKLDESSEEPTSKRSKAYSYDRGEEELSGVTPTHSHYSAKRDHDHENDEDIDRNDIKEKNRKYRDRDYAESDGKKTPTPHRTYHEKISKDNYGRKQHGSDKGVYASTNKCKICFICN